MKRLLQSQRGGVALIMVLAFLSIGTPVVTSTLNQADSLSIDSRTKRDIVESDYCDLAVSEYVRYLTLTTTHWDDWWAAPNRIVSAPGAVPVVGKEVLNFGNCQQISFQLQVSGTPGDPPTTTTSQLTTSKSVSASSASPNAELQYSIVVANPSSSSRKVNLTAIYDGLPLGFTYVLGTTKLNGDPFGDPVEAQPGKDADQYCIFAQNDNLTIEKDQVIPCSVGADDNITVRNDAYIGGNVHAVDGNVDLDQGVTVTGDIKAGGNVTVGQGVTIGGTIRAEGNVTLGQGATVQGNIRAGTGNVLLGQGDVVAGDAVSMTGNVYVNQGSDLAGDIWAGGNVELRQSAAIDRNVWALGNVDLKNSATVGTPEYLGVIIAGGNVKLGQGATVAGGYTEECQAPLCTVPPVPAWTLFDGSGDRLLLTWDTSAAGVTLNPGDSATLTFKVKASAEGGNYCNQAWADPGDTGTSSGMTAKATVGSPSGTQCEGEDVVLTTTVDKQVVASGTQPTLTYTTTIKNNGLTDVHVSMVRLKLPAGFSYVSSSSNYLLQPSGQRS